MRYLFTLTCLLLVTATLADEPDFDFSSLGAKKALRDYKKAVAKDEEEAANLAKKTRDAFVESLEGALKQSMQAGNLDEANKISDAIKALKKGASPAGASKGKKTEARIPKNAIKWRGHHYVVFHSRLSHTAARRFCERAGGHLVRIENTHEQTFIAELATKGGQSDYWIDGSDELREGRWLFSNDMPMHYFNWAGGEPNNSDWGQNNGGLEHHVKMGRNQNWRWNDMPGSLRENCFICEWEGGSSAPETPTKPERTKPKTEEPIKKLSPKHAKRVLDDADLWEGNPGVWFLKRANNFAARTYERLSNSRKIRSALASVNGRLPTKAEMNNPPSRR